MYEAEDNIKGVLGRKGRCVLSLSLVSDLEEGSLKIMRFQGTEMVRVTSPKSK